MKKSLIIILSLILCLMLSCSEKTLDKIFIQGGMDEASPRVIVAVDPDKVEAFERGEVVTIDSEYIPDEVVTEDSAAVIELRIVSDERSVTKEELGTALEESKSSIESDVKLYVDTAVTNSKDEIISYVDEKTEDTLKVLNETNSILSGLKDIPSPTIDGDLKEYVESKLSSLKEEILSYVDKKAEEAIIALETTNSILSSFVGSLPSNLVIDVNVDSELSSIKDEIISYVDEKVEDALGSYVPPVSTMETESFKEYVDASIQGVKEEIFDYIDQYAKALMLSLGSKESSENAISGSVSVYLENIDTLVSKDEIVSYVDSVAEEKSEEIIREIEDYIDSKINRINEAPSLYTVDDVEIPEEIVTIVVRNGIEYAGTPKAYEVVGYVEDITTLMIPEFIDGIPVTTIKEGAFKDCTSLEGDIVLPKSLEIIESEAFMNCKNLDGKIYIPSSLKSIGDRAFYGCSSLKGDLIIPESVETIGDQAFAYCRKLGKSIYGGKGLTDVGWAVFVGSSVEKSYLPPDISELLGF